MFLEFVFRIVFDVVLQGLHVRFRINVYMSWFVSVPVEGALYRIWCGVNRLGDSGVKVV